ncbi:C4-dicarboxylic acid transporter DauA [Endozoicomonas elysicola]|uniref:Transporter n=1 Tax=Endozoicomonas elysicola TaxID=305900 RepID=A0A081KCV4_9GAMM|nr:C4-dicarboxylic acid transporter DauA [Endozoicomonas elysicola]KEI71980.1 transporter [Endozoicomonas elysicola]
MPHRVHLLSLKLCHALDQACKAEQYTGKRFGSDLLAGLTVGIIAIPLSMALAIASGVPPQYGLYTAIISGFIIALLGGSRYSISGPTAAFVVLLFPIAEKFGLAGLLLATVMSGIILVLMALMRLGRLIQYIPESITLGFTAGIGVVIATLQIKDFFGMTVTAMPEHYWDKVAVLVGGASTSHWPSFTIAAVTLAVMLLWPRLRLPVPAHLPAVIIGSVLALFMSSYGIDVETIGSRFHYLLPDGSSGMGIPPVLPEFAWPWQQAGADGQPLGISWSLVQALLPSAFAIAMLGAIESLLCAVVLDGMTGTRHSANSELLGQGVGNIVTPFFGGIPATAAIARSAANVKAGAQSPVAGMIHALVVLLALVALTGILSYIPMSAMAALLLMVAWNMSEAPKALHLLKTAPRSDVLVFLVCFFLTVVFDMVIAISVGVVLAALLFMKEVAEMIQVRDIKDDQRYVNKVLDEDVAVLRIEGPLFFAAADHVFGEISRLSQNKSTIVLQMENVYLLDAGGLSALTRLIEQFRKHHTRLLISDLQFQPLRTLARAGVKPVDGVVKFFGSLNDALQEV